MIPVWSGPVRSGPVWSGLVRSCPVRFGPVRSGPVQSGLVQFGPVRSDLCLAQNICVSGPEHLCRRHAQWPHSRRLKKVSRSLSERGFSPVYRSFVRACGRGEAACGREGRDPPVAGPVDRKLSASSWALFAQYLCAGTWVFKKFNAFIEALVCVFCAQARGF